MKTDALHPVQVRASGFMEVWKTWAAWRDRAHGFAGVYTAQALMAQPRQRYADNADLIEQYLRTDPILNYDVIQVARESPGSFSMFVAAAVMYWSRPQALIELTPALAQWLAHSDLGDDVPLGMVRPPLPACFLRFDPQWPVAMPPLFGGAPHNFYRVQGVYVFEAKRELARALALVPIMESAQGPAGIGSIELVIEDETQSLAELIDAVVAKQHAAAVRAFHHDIAKYCAMTFLYMGVKDARIREDLAYTQAPRQFSELGRRRRELRLAQIERLYDRIVVGPEALPESTDADEGGRHVTAHWRRGHFRMQAHGPRQTLRKLIFVAPTLVKADQLHGQVPAPKTSVVTR